MVFKPIYARQVARFGGCYGKLNLTTRAVTVTELNARLIEARDSYRRAVKVQREAYELKSSVEPNNPDGIMALQNANYQLELTAVKFRQALRDFVTALEPRTNRKS